MCRYHEEYMCVTGITLTDRHLVRRTEYVVVAGPENGTSWSQIHHQQPRVPCSGQWGFGISCTDSDINEWWVANRPTAERRHCTTATACQLLHASYCIDITNRQVGIRILLAVISNAAGMLRVPSTIHRVPPYPYV